MQWPVVAAIAGATVVGATVLSRASPDPATGAGPVAVLAAVVADGDARKAWLIGTSGEVYEPDGNGAWACRLQSFTASPLTAAGRAGANDHAVLAFGDGVIYRLAGNGWSAIRVVQHGKAVLGTGPRAIAAVGRQLFALDAPSRGGEPRKLALAQAPVVAIASGPAATVVATEAGLWRLDPRGKLAPLTTFPAARLGAPAQVRLVSDRWAIVARGALDLTTGALTPWPAGLAIGAAAATPDGWVAVGVSAAGLELVHLRRQALSRDPLGIPAAGATAVGVAVDRAGQAVVALADGRIALRDRTGWSTTRVTTEPAAARPGPGPAASR